MKYLKNIDQMYKLLFSLFIFLLLMPDAQAQEILTLDKALQIAQTGSPDLKRSLLNLERFSKNLEAQRAALKLNSHPA